MDEYATLKHCLGQARERAEVAKSDKFSLFHTLDAMCDTMAVLDEKQFHLFAQECREIMNEFDGCKRWGL